MRHWYVTASHRVNRRSPGEGWDLPYGTAHLRVLGGWFTFCGEAAGLWPIFWDLRIEAADNLCNECARAAGMDPDVQAERFAFNSWSAVSGSEYSAPRSVRVPQDAHIQVMPAGSDGTSSTSGTS